MRAALYRHTVRVSPVRNAKHTWTTREAAVITLSTDAITGFGEVSPLPGYSAESLEQACSWIEQWRFDGNLSTQGRARVLLDELAPSLAGAPASARFGVETAVLDAWCQINHQTQEQALEVEPSSANQDVRVAPLCDVLSADFEVRAGELATAGHRVVKVKVGRDIEKESANLRRLVRHYEAVHCPLLLRLDANGTLPPAKLEHCFARWSELPVAYVEEPCPLPALGQPRMLSLKLAFDETLREGLTAVQPWLDIGQVAALVCKPMYLGGIRASLSWIEIARRYQVAPVLSHLFDGPLANGWYVALARYADPHNHHGLFPTHTLEAWSDVVSRRQSAWGGRVEFVPPSR